MIKPLTLRIMIKIAVKSLKNFQTFAQSQFLSPCPEKTCSV